MNCSSVDERFGEKCSITRARASRRPKSMAVMLDSRAYVTLSGSFGPLRARRRRGSATVHVRVEPEASCGAGSRGGRRVLRELESLEDTQQVERAHEGVA